MEYFQVAKWSNTSNLFFDDFIKTLFYIHQDRLFIPGSPHSTNLSPYSKYLSRPLLKACLDEAREFLIVQTKERVLNILALKSVCASKIRMKSSILGFISAKNRAIGWDICVVSISGLDFFKLEEDLKASPKSSISLQIAYYHFDTTVGILAVYSSGNVILYSIYPKKSLLLCKFPIECNISELPGVSNLLNYTLPQLDNKFVILAGIYHKFYLISLDGFAGQLRVYKKNQIKFEFSIDPGAYNIRIIDNMIILHNFGLQESTIFDWYSQPKSFKLGHRGSFELNPTLIQLSNEFAVDLNDRLLLKLKLDPISWTTQMPSSLFSTLFLMRRANLAEKALAFVKALIESNQNIDEILSKIVKGEDMLPIITQEQLLSFVFAPCYKDLTNLSCLVKSLVLYCKELIANNISIETNLQMLLIRVLIKANEFGILENLIEYELVEDSKEVALVLVDLSRRNKFLNGYMMAIDMLYRMKMHTVAMDVMISQGDFMEAMSYSSEHPCPGYDLNKLNKDSTDKYTNTIIQEFLKENIY